MNELTIKRKQKGYSQQELLDVLGISLSTYRRWEKEGHQMNAWLNDKVDQLESNNERV